MFDVKMMRTIGALAARQARAVAQDAKTTANEVIDLCPLLKPWRPGVWNAGDVVGYAGCPYLCVQPHDSMASPEWTPPAAPALFSPFHGTDRAHALAWQAPTGAQDAYQEGEWMIWTDGAAYRCLADGTVHAPDVLPESWEAEA